MQIDLNQLQNTNVPESIQQLADVSLTEYLELITPLLVYMAGMTLYAVFVFSFYRYLGRRDLVRLRHVDYLKGFVGVLEKAGHVVFNFVENVILTPILVFFWFVFMASVLLLLSKNYTAESVMLISASVVGTVRSTAYYAEALSQDIAKMIPFALLGIFIVDINYFDWGASLEVAQQLPAFWGTLAYYFVFIVALELLLRVASTLLRLFSSASKEPA